MSSKLRKLKQQAYEAGRRRDWTAAADAYAQILEQDKNNPSLLNEYGDVCLKSGDAAKAIRQFLSAASKYRQSGLLNNAQAVYKKVLRHEPGNLNANWYLAEIRAAQGLLVEGAKHAMVFLASAEEVSGEIKEIFLKRCLELFTLYPENDQILEKVEGIFRLWNLRLEAARAGCLRACLAYGDGNSEAAFAAVAKLVEAVPEIVNYVEHTRWLEKSGQKTPAAEYSDVNTIDLDQALVSHPQPAAERQSAERRMPVNDDPTGADTHADILGQGGPGSVHDSTMEGLEDFSRIAPDRHGDEEADAFGDCDIEPGLIDSANMPSVSVDIERDEEGCISIDVEGESSFADLLEVAADSLSAAGVSSDQSSHKECDDNLTERDASLFEGRTTGGPASGSVNLLDEILAEEGEDIVRSSDSEQVSTIASEIGRNLSETADADPEDLYQQGLVYLEMGLYDQAVVALSSAARDESYRLRACEMWGIALQRGGQIEEALKILEEGIATSDAGGREALGLRYHAGRILEDLGRMDEAQAHYRAIHACDAGFADVIRRLRIHVG